MITPTAPVFIPHHIAPIAPASLVGLAVVGIAGFRRHGRYLAGVRTALVENSDGVGFLRTALVEAADGVGFLRTTLVEDADGVGFLRTALVEDADGMYAAPTRH